MRDSDWPLHSEDCKSSPAGLERQTNFTTTMSAWEHRGAKAAQAEAAVQMLTTALAKPNPVERTISARLREAKQAMADYGEKHFALIHRIKENVVQVQELKDNDVIIRDTFFEAEGKAEDMLERFEIAARPAGPSPDSRIAIAVQESLGQKTATVDRLALVILHLEGLRVKGEPITPEEYEVKGNILVNLEKEAKVSDVKHKELTALVTREKPAETVAYLQKEQAAKKEIDCLLDEYKMSLGGLTVQRLPEQVLQPVGAVERELPVDIRPGVSSQSPYYMYQKETIPKFNGGIREYPAWRKEWSDFIIPVRGEEWALRAIDKYTPKSVDLQNCETLAEALSELDAKYADSVNVSGTLVHDFVAFTTKATGDESKLVELKGEVMRLFNDLKAVKQEAQLTQNAWLLSQIAQKLPIPLQKEFSRIKSSRSAENMSLWESTSSYLKDEAKRYERDLPHLLDSHRQTAFKGRLVKDDDYKEDRKSKEVISKINLVQSKRFEEMKLKIGACPHCSEHHSFVGGKTKEEIVSASFRNCKEFLDLDVRGRASVVEANKACAQCLDWRHDRTTCEKVKKPCGKREGASKCTKLHNWLLHGSTTKYCNNIALSQGKQKKTVLLHMFSMTFSNYGLTITCFMDDGSEITLIKEELARSMKLVGKKGIVWLQLAGETKPTRFELNHYKVVIPLNDGTRKTIEAVGVPHVTDNNAGTIDVSIAYKLFPHLPKGAVDRSDDAVGLLIGQDNAELLPSGGEGKDRVGGLRVMRVNLGSGWVMGGHHPKIEGELIKFTALTNSLRSGARSAQIKRVNFIRNTCPIDVPYLDPEDLSITLPRRCSKCLNCQRCTEEVQEMSRREQEELRLIRANLTVDRKRRKLVAKYPFIKDPSRLKDNEWQAKKMAEQLERKLTKKEGLEAYNREFQVMLDFPAIKRVSRKELFNWKEGGGKINFISHHDVNRPNKATTQKRMVSNSSMPNAGTGPAVNELWPKGPNLLKPALKIFLRFRTHEVGVVFDLTKAYWSVETTEEEKFLRLLLWRWGREEKDWEVFGFCTMAFGDRPAMAILEEGKERAVEEGGHLDLLASKAISEDSYCDDGLTGGSAEEVSRMIGDCSKEEDGTLTYSGTIAKVLATVGFKVKMMVSSRSCDVDAMEKMGGSVLGHKWDPMEDEFSFKFAVNISKKGRDGLHPNPDLTEFDIPHLKDHIATRRSVLSVVNSLYDPSGLISAYTIKFKLFMREVTAINSKWDEPLPTELQIRWRELLAELVSMPVITIHRCVHPPGATGQPELIIYWDGSILAYSAVAYLRYKDSEYDQNQEWTSGLLTSKAKLAPTAGITSPRSEMNGFVLAHRLAMVIISALRVKPSRLTFIGDSECTISAAEFNSAFLKPYLANRVAEVDDMMAAMKLKYPDMKIDPPYHTPGPENSLADMATRGMVQAHQVSIDSEWQTGRPYLRKSREYWPITREFVRTVPEEEKRLRVFNMVNLVSNVSLEEPEEIKVFRRMENIPHYSHSLNKVRGVMARLLRISAYCANFKKRSTTLEVRPKREELEEIAKKSISVEEYSRADKMILLLSQKDVREVLDKPQRDKYKASNETSLPVTSLQPFKRDGIWVTRGRFGKALKRILGPDSLPILSPTSRLAQLYLLDSHERNHMGGGDCLFRSRAKAWVIRGRTQADKIVRACLVCKRKTKRFMEQQMGDLPEERTSFPDKPWSSTSIDLLGSYEVRAMNNQRSKKKCYPVVCCCMITGALHIELAHDYGTDAFLCAYSSFTSIRSRPAMVYTDRGSQLSKASQYIAEEDPIGWNWEAVKEVEAKKGTKWRFCPAGAQFRNGLAESRVKALKHTMDLLMVSGASSLNFNEFRCLLNRAADIINDRPLGVRHHRSGVEGELLPITPNLLLLGKSSASTPDPPQAFDDSDDQFTRRAAFISSLEKVWWDLWFTQAFDSLFPLPKWKEKMVNLAPGDIVLVGWEVKLGKGQYRLAKVKMVEKDDKGLVRTATVLMRPKDSRDRGLPYRVKALKEMKVAIQRLVLICPVESVPAPVCSAASGNGSKEVN